MASNKLVQLSGAENKDWAQAIGGVFLNFGLLEFISYRFVEILSNDVMLRDVAIEMQFARRIQLIKKLIERSTWTNEEKLEALQLWGEAAKASEIRNTVAHNPFSSGKDQNGNDAKGILRARDMVGVGPYAVTLIQLRQLVDTATRAGEIALALNRFIEGNKTGAAQ